MNHLIDSGLDHQIYSGKRNLESWDVADQFRQSLKKVEDSMLKIPNMKRPDDIRRRLDSIMDFKLQLLERRDLLPFDGKFIGGLIKSVDEFMTKYGGEVK